MLFKSYISEEVLRGAWEIIVAPVYHTGMIPTLMPIVLGGVVLELYFGKYSEESLGWNSSVSNSIIWVSTGLTLLLTADLGALSEKAVSYFLICLGGFVGYMNFFHKWSATVAFIASSSGVVYSVAYVSVVMIKSGMEVNETSLQSAAISLAAIGLFFQAIKFIEPSVREPLEIQG